jgi:hypothetical protein
MSESLSLLSLKNSRRKPGSIFGLLRTEYYGARAGSGWNRAMPGIFRKLSWAAHGTRVSVRPFSRVSRGKIKAPRPRLVESRESDMISEMQIHTIARQMMEKHGLTAIAQAAANAQACESKGDAEEAKEWRHVEDAMKMMRGPHQS